MDWRELQPYIGLRYETDFDCADFAVHVARDLFGKRVTLPGDRPRGKGSEKTLGDASKAYGVPTETPEDGDIVLMCDFGHNDASHVGIFIRAGSAQYVLHSAERLGGSVLTEIRKLRQLGITLEGFYKWIL